MEMADRSNSQSASFKLSNFEITLSHDEAQLTIHAEQEETLKHFSIIITPEQVKDITAFVFKDIEVMYLELLEAFEHKTAGVKLSITDDARIIYSEEREIRGKVVKEGFTLWLDEEKIDEHKKQEKRMDNMLKQIAQLESRIVVLEKENSNLIERMGLINQLEGEIAKLKEENIILRADTETMHKKMEELLIQKIQNLEKGVIPATQKEMEKTFMSLIETKVSEHVEQKLKSSQFLKRESQNSQASVDSKFEFDPTCTYASYFSISGGNQTIVYNSQSDWMPCLIKQKLSKSEKTVFSVRVDQTSQSNVLVGICPSSLRTQKGLYSRKGVYCYNGYSNGHVWSNAQYTALNKVGLKTGSIITVTVDLLSNTINYQVNGALMNTTSLDLSSVNSEDFYPYVELFDKNDKASLV